MPQQLTDRYAYRLWLKGSALMALLPFPTLELAWAEISNCPLLTFQYPDSKGAMIECSVKSDCIQAIDRPWGTEPVSQYKPLATVKKNVSNRAQVYDGKVVLGQTAKEPKNDKPIR